MQAQRLRTQTKHITSTQSLATVQTLLKAGLGCIAFLRNLLPEDNFTESHFTTDEPESSQSSMDSFSTIPGSLNERRVDGFKIITMARGYTDEADRILNYLEMGIFDAIEKQYLRSFIFAIYLDNNDPNNIIEAYTFNFQYHKIAGTDTVVPLMSLGRDFQSMSLRKETTHNDPVSEAIRKGGAPTLKDVKKSVKALLKTLIHVMSQMDVLPKRRYATFKLLYTDETPEDYEPPHFKPGDINQDKWYFMTHDMDEVPDKWNIGKLRTGYHSVNLSVTSISTYLPSSMEDDHGTYANDVPNALSSTTLSGMQEANLRVQEVEKQVLDAECRNIVWSAEQDFELCDEDAEGDIDPEYAMQLDRRYERTVTVEEPTPDCHLVGIRNSNGDIDPIPTIRVGQESENQFHGISEAVPTCLKEIAAKKTAKEVTIEETQPLTITTQETPLSSHKMDDNMCSIFSSRAPSLTSPVMSETQMNNSEMIEESIHSFASQPKLNTLPAEPRDKTGKVNGRIKFIDRGLQCECGVMTKGDCCLCEGTCGRWYHIWCMGFHSAQDTRIPEKFICFDCRIRGDISWELVKMDLYPRMLAKFKELALFRRAIKISETKRPATIAEFARSFGGDQALARQLINRLEAEGFISQQATALESEFSQTLNTRNKTKGKITNARKHVYKRRYAFNQASKLSSKYSDYFNPDAQIENRLLGLSNLVSKPCRRKALPEVSTCDDHGGNQTPATAQQGGNFHAGIKRTSNAMGFNATRIEKKIKISVATGVDLAE